MNINASRLHLDFEESELFSVVIRYIGLLEGLAGEELISYQYDAYDTNTYRRDQFDRIIDILPESPVYPGLKGENVVFGVALLIFICSILYLRRKKIT